MSSIVLLVACLVACLGVGLRNYRVYECRQGVLAELSRLIQQDRAAGRDWRRRYQHFGSVSYGRMMVQFWRPVASFYPPITEQPTGTTP